jgi:hypothetical protein
MHINLEKEVFEQINVLVWNVEILFSENAATQNNLRIQTFQHLLGNINRLFVWKFFEPSLPVMRASSAIPNAAKWQVFDWNKLGIFNI